MITVILVFSILIFFLNLLTFALVLFGGAHLEKLVKTPVAMPIYMAGIDASEVTAPATDDEMQ